ncbi:MAG: peptide chain release factor N(5)-glutamine methyltransferase, partial [Kiloniellales bacterium]|nr:peptide chain release factor N(5)-glutamine methyltransferase [Kiloniellales bacterium]
LRPGAALTADGRVLTEAELRDYEALIARRNAREPVSRILGRREFWSLDLEVTPATLDPRPDSETLVQAVLELTADPHKPRRVLDLGTGSGNLLLAVLASLPGAWGLGLDRDPDALGAAARNASRLNLANRAAFLASDWGSALTGTWDVILCNPPYVRTGEIDDLVPEVAQFEPRGALDGGADGLAAYRRVVPEIARLLAPDGLAALELGAGQAVEVAGLAGTAGLEARACLPDLAGIQRCLLLGQTGDRGKEDGGEKKVVGIPGRCD